jgi:DNA topoisomerase-6 subunit B
MPENIRAYELAKKQREISVSEFFMRNRHLLGFDNPVRALLMTVKEAVDNSLDACADLKILPEIKVTIRQISDNRFKVIVEDNGPGIVKQQIPNIFAKLLYGSKFHSLKQNRGQQGIGISASVLYSQLTTGKATKIVSRISKKKPAHFYELHIDTKKNEPRVITDQVVDWEKDHGTKIELELEAKYLKSKQSVDEYIKQTAIVNPHAHIIYTNPEKKRVEYPRVTKEVPEEGREIKPHPHGVELGNLIKMLHETKSKTLLQFLTHDFCRVGSKTAKGICQQAELKERKKPKDVTTPEAEKLYKSIQKAKVIAPPTDCLSPIRSELLEKGLKKEINAEFYVTTTRPPSVYRGMPFQIEAGIAYGGEIPPEGTIRLMRFANRVPLLYQQGACSITKSVSETNWRPYGLSQSSGNLPQGQAMILVHIASVWVPFTSEAKEAIAHYPEIIKEIKRALQECGRKLSIYIHKKRRAHHEAQKKSYIEKYIPHIGIALKDILSLTQKEQDKTIKVLKQTLEKSRK